MKLQFTKFSVVNALWSLIPIFPTWTIFPGVLLAMGIERLGVNCEYSYIVVLWISIAMSLLLGYLYIKQDVFKQLQDLKLNFRIWSLGIYTSINTAGLIIYVGPYLACYGDGQSILAVIFTGPIASLLLIIFGITVDLVVKLKGVNGD